MAIPGSKPKIEPFAKVRIGETRTSAKGNAYPAATDYFRSDAPEFAAAVGDKPKSIRIRLVHDTVDDAFSTGLEWWIKDKNQRSLLACYTKDSGDNPVALRMDGMLNPGMQPLSPETVGNNRLRIACAARDCPQFKQKQGCKPMGRLVFTLDGDPLSRVWELDTKAWSSIEAIEGVLRVAQTNSPLAGRLFELSVRWERKGDDRFPVMSIREITDLDAQTGKAVAQAEATVAAEQTDGDLRAKVIAALEASGRDPRSPAVAEWVKEQGLEKALEKLTRPAS